MNTHRTRIVVAGEFPPPIGGQNIMVKQLFDELSKVSTYNVEHLRFNFSPTFSDLRKFSWRKVFEVFRVWGRMLRLRFRGRIDVLWFPSGGPQTAPILRDILLLPLGSLLARRTIVQFHAAGIAERLERSHDIPARLASRVYQSCADSAIVMTPFNRRDPEALGVREISVIPHQLDDRYEEASINRPLENRLCFLYVGHLYDLKGTPQLLEAFSSVAATHQDVHLTLVGGFLAPYSKSQFSSQIKRLGLVENVSYAGEVRGDDVDQYYSSADCFVFPSIAAYESFGMVLIEAMMWGLPIVATDWRGNRDVIGDPPGGIIFEPTDTLTASLESALRSACNRRPEWKSWGKENRKRYLQFFRRTYTNRYEALIHQNCSNLQ